MGNCLLKEQKIILGAIIFTLKGRSVSAGKSEIGVGQKTVKLTNLAQKLPHPKFPSFVSI